MAKKDEPHITYLNMGCFPLFVGFANDAKAFDKEMKRLGVDDPPTLTVRGAPATCHIFTHEKNGLMVIITIDKTKAKGKSKPQIAALIAHEAVHCWQACREDIGEKQPGHETEAYFIQHVAQFCMYEMGFK